MEHVNYLPRMDKIKGNTKDFLDGEMTMIIPPT